MRGMRFPRYVQCSRAGVVAEDGKLYCRQHVPSKRQEEKQRSFDDSILHFKKKRLAAERADACVAAMLGIPDPAAFVAAAKEMRGMVFEFGKDCWDVRQDVGAVLVRFDAAMGVG